jgi:hypothetical protein
MKRELLTATTFVLCLASVLHAQAPDLAPGSEQNAVPTIVFEFVMPESNPAHYAITVDAIGRAAYRSDPQPAESDRTPGDPFLTSFVVSNATRERIFQLAKELDYFQSNDFDFKGKVANMGAKTLLYRDGGKEYRSAYNYTTNVKVQELTKLFQGISATLEYVHRLERLHRFEPLGLDAEVKRLEADQKAGRLEEAQLLEPVLSAIAENHTVMNITRRRAQTVLARIGAKDQAKR